MLQATEITAKVSRLELLSERLCLRRLTPTDDAAQIEHEMNPAIMGMIRDPMPLDQVTERLREFSGSWQAAENAWVGLAVDERSSGSFTGLVFFRVISYELQSVEIGYRLHPDFWRRGFTTEAGLALMTFLKEELKVRKAVAYCVADNAGSIRVLDNLGFAREGCLKEHSYLAGRWQDELVFGRVLWPAAPAP